VKNNVKTWIAAAVAVWICAGTVPARSQTMDETATDVTVITSDKLTFDYVAQYAFFEGNVVVVDPQMKIYSDTMMVVFDQGNRARNIKAEGNVVIIQEDKRAKSDVAEYEIATGKIVLNGNPMITSGRNILTADIMRFWRDENRLECEPNARVVIYPDDDTSTTLFGDPAGGS
jgi:lipopolysaccharide export system protein LptA